MWLSLLVICFSVPFLATEGVNLTATVCDNAWMLLECQVRMTVLSANYGRLDKTTCPASNAIGSAPLNTTTCSAALSLSYVQSQCNGQQFCAVWASTSLFGEPCNGTSKYLTVTYSCPETSMIINTSVACEGSTMTLQCPTGYIDILSWNYGRLDNYTCPAGNAIGSYNLSNTNCLTTANPYVVNPVCDRKRNCSISVNSTTFGGDPCVGIAKYLTVTYSCTSVGAELACENTTLNLQCPSGVISILRAHYGRTDATTCGRHTYINCEKAGAVNTVRNVCDGQQNCSIMADNTVFGGDPCPAGVGKYLTLIYYCQVVATNTTSTKSPTTTTRLTTSTPTSTTTNATTSTTKTSTSTTSVQSASTTTTTLAIASRTATTDSPSTTQSALDTSPVEPSQLVSNSDVSATTQPVEMVTLPAGDISIMWTLATIVAMCGAIIMGCSWLAIACWYKNKRTGSSQSTNNDDPIMVNPRPSG